MYSSVALGILFWDETLLISFLARDPRGQTIFFRSGHNCGKDLLRNLFPRVKVAQKMSRYTHTLLR